jgi:hypothetical protein
MADRIASAALKNTTVQNAVKKSLFESVMGKEPDDAEAQAEDKRTSDASVIEGILYRKLVLSSISLYQKVVLLLLLFILK